MNMDITAIERHLRLFGLPTFITLMGIAGMVLLSEPAEAVSIASSAFSPVANVLFPVSAALAFTGLVWLSWSLWQLYRWKNGNLVGECHNCGGVMSHKDGRYGTYRVCKMCGAKREG
ncbi:hypothetical protein [Pseudomonas sp. GWSMS-1]|jgi:hypothetical protein|uniref:hypothetical protein n=1 Tax=Pseudomonas sp. GWSMS-1 TaxID=3308997 RepID=UPI003CF919A8